MNGVSCMKCSSSPYWSRAAVSPRGDTTIFSLFVVELPAKVLDDEAPNGIPVTELTPQWKRARANGGERFAVLAYRVPPLGVTESESGVNGVGLPLSIGTVVVMKPNVGLSTSVLMI